MLEVESYKVRELVKPLIEQVKSAPSQVMTGYWNLSDFPAIPSGQIDTVHHVTGTLTQTLVKPSKERYSVPFCPHRIVFDSQFE